MPRRTLIALLACASTVAVVAGQTFRTGVDLVHFTVIVTDKQGAPVTGLKAEDFEVVEEGKGQTISYFTQSLTSPMLRRIITFLRRFG